MTDRTSAPKLRRAQLLGYRSNKAANSITSSPSPSLPLGWRSSRSDAVLVVGGAFVTGSSSTIMHLAGTSGPTVAFFRFLYALPVLTVLAVHEIRRAGRPGWRQISVGAISGVFLALDLILWFSSIESIGAGLSTVVQDTQIIFVAAGAWLVFGSRPSRRLVLLLPALLAGIVLISGVTAAKQTQTALARGTLLGVASAVAYAGFLLAMGWQPDRRQEHNSTFLTTVTIAGGIVALAVGLGGAGIDLRPTWPGTGWLILLALTTQVFGWLVIAAAMFRVSSLQASIVLLLQPVSALLLGWAALSEKPSGLQLLGVAIVVISTVFAVGADRHTAEPPSEVGDVVGEPAS